MKDGRRPFSSGCAFHTSKKVTPSVLSVGGGKFERKGSTNIVKAIQLALEVRAKVLGIVGRDGGYTARMADAAMVILPSTQSASRRTRKDWRPWFRIFWLVIRLFNALRQNGGLCCPAAGPK